MFCLRKKAVTINSLVEVFLLFSRLIDRFRTSTSSLHRTQLKALNISALARAILCPRVCWRPGATRASARSVRGVALIAWVPDKSRHCPECLKSSRGRRNAYPALLMVRACFLKVLLYQEWCFFRLVTSVGQRKNSESSRGIEPQTFGFRAPMLYHWATETPRWRGAARSVTKLKIPLISLSTLKIWTDNSSLRS